MTATLSEQRPLLSVRDLKKFFPGPAGAPIQAVAGVTFDVQPGEVLGIVGETGSGKSTLIRSMLMLDAPTAGTVDIDGERISSLRGTKLREARQNVQLIFQDPHSCLDGRWRVIDSICEPMRNAGVSRTEARRRARKLIERVGLDPHTYASKFPRELSGGQVQRIAIARAIATSPKLLVCDEPVSALDVSVQAQIINLFEELRRDLGLTIVFISHDLSVVRHMCDRVAVLYLGTLCEVGPVTEVLQQPAHPYTQALLDAVPGQARDRERVVLKGELPSPSAPPTGCRFRTRCPMAQERCAVEVPELSPTGDAFVACHFPMRRSA